MTNKYRISIMIVLIVMIFMYKIDMIGIIEV